jgi:hypothetical protein
MILGYLKADKHLANCLSSGTSLNEVPESSSSKACMIAGNVACKEKGQFEGESCSTVASNF